METGQPDIVVVGSGAAGMTAALTASLLGMTAQVVEKAPVIGGTTALSARSAMTFGTIAARHMAASPAAG